MKVRMENIGFCYYGRNRILKDVDLEIRGGEVTALLGENGAGKSTLMNILGGILPLQEGILTIDGKPVSFSCPKDSIRAGIGFVHQELNLINDLTVYENIFLSDLPKKGAFLNKAEMIRKTEELFTSLNIKIDPLALVGDLDVSCRQITEICRSLLQNAKIIIMDEPTTSLTEEEIRRVFGMMHTLKEKGVGIVFISHKLNEVTEICDTYTVLRNGEVAKTGSVAQTNARELAECLVGHSLSDATARKNVKYGPEVLRLEHFSDGKHFEDINLSVRAGEILGVTGLLGDGRSEIFQTVFGLKGSKYKGRLYYCGKEYRPKSTRYALKNGIAYVPADRKNNGILKDLSVIENLCIVTLEKLKKGLFLDRKRTVQTYEEQKEKYRIKSASGTNPITGLSGGNQQKVVIAKFTLDCPGLLILDNPTQGVDIGAKAEIYAKIRQLADDGTAVILLSPEAQEIVSNCESACVLFHGRVAGHLSGGEMNEYNIMNYATGGK